MRKGRWSIDPDTGEKIAQVAREEHGRIVGYDDAPCPDGHEWTLDRNKKRIAVPKAKGRVMSKPRPAKAKE
jgi:hypothetical protein